MQQEDKFMYAHIDEKNELLGWYTNEKTVPEPFFIKVTKNAWKDALLHKHNKINIDGTTELSDFRTDEEILKSTRELKLYKINSSTKTKIISGFISKTLGVEHKYQSEEIDQLNLLDKVAAGVDQKIKCSADDGVTWELKMHTVEQLKNVLKDGSLYKNQLLESGEALKNKVRACKTLEELELVKI